MRLNLSKLNNLTTRAITAVFGVILVVGSILYSPWTYFLVFFFICMLSILEFYKLIGIDGMLPLKFWGTLSGLLFYTLAFLVESQYLSGKYYFLLFPVLFIVFFIKLYRKSDNKPFTNIAFTFLGIFYVATPFALLHFIAFCHQHYSYEILIGILLIIWANDTGAYFAGSKFGRTKLFHRISPKKTWEGFVGGVIMSAVIALVLIVNFPELAFYEWLIVGAIIVTAGTYGDLVESLFKRSIKIKDSGKAIPGHGGFLDRFDGLLSSIPFIAAYLKIF